MQGVLGKVIGTILFFNDATSKKAMFHWVTVEMLWECNRGRLAYYGNGSWVGNALHQME